VCTLEQSPSRLAAVERVNGKKIHQPPIEVHEEQIVDQNVSMI
jgi:hypothetical protein